MSTPSLHTKEPSTEWQGQDFQEFVPQTFDGQMVRLARYIAYYAALSFQGWRRYFFPSSAGVKVVVPFKVGELN